MEQTMPLKDWVRKVLYIIAIAKKDKDIIYNPEKLTKDFSYLVRKYHGDGIDPPRAARKILNWAEKKGEGEMPEEPSYEPQDEKGIFESKICRMIDEEVNTVIDSPEENEGYGDIPIRLSYAVLNVFQRYWEGQGDPLYAVLSRRGNSVDWVTVKASQEEIDRLEEVARKILEDPETEEGEKATAKQLLDTLPNNDGDDLLLYLENDDNLYNRWFTPIVKNLVRKQAVGRYDHFLAIKGFLYLVDAAAKKYTQEFEEGQIWNKVFPKNVRIEVAKKLVSEFEYDFEDGQYSHFIPKKYQVKKEENKLEEDNINIKESDKQMKKEIKSHGLPGYKKQSYFKPEDPEPDTERLDLLKGLTIVGVEDMKKKGYDFINLKMSDGGVFRVYSGNWYTTGESSVKESDKQMKITKESLLKIIREEIEKVIKEEPIESNPQYGKEEDHSETPDETNTPLKEDKEELEEEEVRGKGEEDYSEVDHLVAEKKEKLKEEAPPGRESQVKALKKELPKTYIDKKSDERKESNPWAVSWAQYNKSKKE